MTSYILIGIYLVLYLNYNQNKLTYNKYSTKCRNTQALAMLQNSPKRL